MLIASIFCDIIMHYKKYRRATDYDAHHRDNFVGSLYCWHLHCGLEQEKNPEIPHGSSGPDWCRNWTMLAENYRQRIALTEIKGLISFKTAWQKCQAAFFLLFYFYFYFFKFRCTMRTSCSFIRNFCIAIWTNFNSRFYNFFFLSFFSQFFINFLNLS